MNLEIFFSRFRNFLPEIFFEILEIRVRVRVRNLFSKIYILDPQGFFIRFFNR